MKLKTKVYILFNVFFVVVERHWVIRQRIHILRVGRLDIYYKQFIFKLYTFRVLLKENLIEILLDYMLVSFR